jgi:phage terminase large subunit-like protein
MRLGVKTQVDALVVMFTNSGFDKTSVCWTKHDYGIKVLEGTVVDDQYFAYVCQLDPCEPAALKGATQPNDGCPRATTGPTSASGRR